MAQPSLHPRDPLGLGLEGPLGMSVPPLPPRPPLPGRWLSPCAVAEPEGNQRLGLDLQLTTSFSSQDLLADSSNPAQLGAVRGVGAVRQTE